MQLSKLFKRKNKKRIEPESSRAQVKSGKRFLSDEEIIRLNTSFPIPNDLDRKLLWQFPPYFF